MKPVGVRKCCDNLTVIHVMYSSEICKKTTLKIVIRLMCVVRGANFYTRSNYFDV